MPAQRRTDLQIRARIVKQNLLFFRGFAGSEVRHGAADTSESDHAELRTLKDAALAEAGGQPVDQTLRKDRTTDFQFHGCSGPREYCKRRRLLFKKKHAERSLFDAAHRIALQELGRYSGDTKPTVIQNENAFDATSRERLSHDLPESSTVLFKVLIKLSRLRHGRVDDSDAALA